MTKSKLTKEHQIKIAEEYDNSRPIDVWWLSDYPEVKSAIDYIHSEMKVTGKIKPQYAKKYREHIRAIVLELFVLNQSDPTQYTGYSRNSSKYSGGSRYKALFFSYRITRNVIDFLIENGYAEGPKGFRRPENPQKSRQSRLRATDKLINLVMNKYKVALPMIKKDERKEIIVLRDKKKKKQKKGKILDYDDTDKTNLMRENLKLINRNLEKHAILLYVPDSELIKINDQLRRDPDPDKRPIDFTSTRLHRTFNNGSLEFDQGGRFYGGWWQNIPREYRKCIRIDDKDVVECDYSGLHINMLYAKEGLPLPKEDPYTIDGYGDIRDFLKQVLLRFINAKSVASVIRSIKDRRNPNEAIAIPAEIESLEKVIKDFMIKHSEIEKYFRTGIGVDLQNVDSQIAERVLLHFSKMGYAILPMHDSFIIHHSLMSELQDSMDSAFYDKFKVKCKIDLKYDSIEERQGANDGEPEVCEASLAELLEEESEYGTYFRLLSEHRQYVQRKTSQKEGDAE